MPRHQTEPAHTLLFFPENLAAPASMPDIEVVVTAAAEVMPEPPNDEQRAAMKRSFQARASLLWGPPGTGKTTVIAGTAVAWLEAAEVEGNPVVIGIGASNWDAIDKLLDEIQALIGRRIDARGAYGLGLHVARVRSDYAEPYRRPGIEDVGRHSDAAVGLAKEMEDPHRSIIVAGTWQQLSKLAGEQGGGKSKPARQWLDLLLIDEASQMKVAPAAAYFLLLRSDGHVVIGGDDRQLGPIYNIEVEQTPDGLLDCIFAYWRDRVPTTALLRNYRTNIEISDWPRIRFYPEDYMPARPDRRLDLVLADSRPNGWPEHLPWSDLWLRVLDPVVPVVAITYPRRPYTLNNPIEAQAVAALATLLRIADSRSVPEEEDFWRSRLGIVTPHRAQMASIRNLLLRTDLFHTVPPAVATVDRFQGRDRDVIFASYAVADPDFIRSEEEFILSPRRFNVTLTRAKSKFVLFMSDALVDYLPSDMKVAINAAHVQLFILDYCGSPVSETLPYLDGTQSRTIDCRVRAHAR